jgi:putative transposase
LFVQKLNMLTKQANVSLLKDLGLNRSKYYQWMNRKEKQQLEDIKPVGKNPNQLLPEEEALILQYYQTYRYMGYRRYTYTLLDKNIVAVDPSTLYRLLSKHGLLTKWVPGSLIGKKPPEPTKPNQRWHTDLMQISIFGDIYYLQNIIDGYSRYIVNWDVHIDGSALNTSTLLQQASETLMLNEKPEIVADNGPEFRAKEFRQIANLIGKKIKIRAYHPQSNGVAERLNRTVKEECLSKASYDNLIAVKSLLGKWVKEYNETRLHASLEYMTPITWHKGNPALIRKERKAKLEAARLKRIKENKRCA